MKKYSRVLLVFGCFTILIAESATACRLWAVIAQKGYALSGSGSDNGVLIGEELTALYNEGASQEDGWSLSYASNNQIIEGKTVFRSPITSTQDSLRFFSAVSTILDSSLGTTLAIGHLRPASSGAVSIPNPHPFLFTYDGICYSFVLNGTFDREPFINLLTRDGKDSSWLMKHPPHTYGNGDWRGAGFTSVVATELYLSWIMKNIAESGDIVTGIASALVAVFDIIPSAGSRNFIFSDGKRLFISGGSGNLSYSLAPYAVVYGNRTYSVAHHAVMTEPPTTGAAGAMAWTPVLDNQLLVLTTDMTETYSYDALKALSKRNAITMKSASYYDNGGDGYIDSIYVTVNGALTPERIREIGDSSLMRLPGQRKFTIRKYIPIDSVSFAMAVTQYSAANFPITNTLPYDRLTAIAHPFAVGGRLFAGDTAIHDRVAPVIISARVRINDDFDTGAAHDTLYVKFSEPVTISVPTLSLQPFIFKRYSASEVKEFTPTLSLCSPSVPSDSLSFVVAHFNHPSIERFMENDSLWISASADWVGDTAIPTNYQRHAGNRRQAVAIDTAIGNPRPEIDFFPGNKVRLQVRAQVSGQAKLSIISITGRRVRESTVSVRKHQWVSLRWGSAGNQKPFARGMLLFSLSLGDMQKHGFIYTTQNRQLEMRVED